MADQPPVTVGLEIHQQLDTGKLFCRCPTHMDEEVQLNIVRQLRPTQSEMGLVDAAALAEARKGRTFTYEGSHDTSCLVEADEEPPHALNEEALDITLKLALMTDARAVDEVHTMRKIVIDGSNTAGFQRTALVALGGAVETAHGPVGLQTMALEEDAARVITRGTRDASYRLDRLGIPLIEIATEPVLHDGAHAREAALALGMLIRATGKAKRGLGTIRQDLNVSTPVGTRCEIKGVQDLDAIPLMIEQERLRQEKLAETAERLRRAAKVEALAAGPRDVSGLLRATSSTVLKRSLAEGGRVFALALPGFNGLLGKKEDGPHRLGAELAGYARAQGATGLFHTDELPAYGITADEVAAVHKDLGTDHARDAFALVAAPADVAKRSLDAALERARLAFKGVPPETREALEDGTSRYLRPLPGSARMYPETDVPPVRVDEARLAHLRAALPETADTRARRYVEQLGLAPDVARTLAFGQVGFLFDDLVKESNLPRETARLLLQTRPELERKGVTVGDDLVRNALRALAQGRFAKEALPDLLAVAALEKVTIEKAAAKAGAANVGEADVREVVRGIVHRNLPIVIKKKDAAMGPLMGEAMKVLKGKAEGELISRVLKEEIAAALRRAGDA